MSYPHQEFLNACPMVTHKFWLHYSRWKKPVTIWFGADCSVQEFAKHYRLPKRELLDVQTKNAEGMFLRTAATQKEKHGKCYMWVEKKDPVVLAHECTHMALSLILQHRRSKMVTQKDSEVLASLVHTAFNLLSPLIA